MDAARSLQAMTSDSREPECATLPYSVLFSVTSTVILQTLKQALDGKTGALKCLFMVHAVMQMGLYCLSISSLQYAWQHALSDLPEQLSYINRS